MTKATEILDDDAIAEIEREPWCHSYGDDRLEAPLGTRRVAITVSQRDALCQTVRALKAERLQMLAALERAQQDRNSWRRTSERLETEKQALQSQLEQVTKERDELKDNMARLGRARAREMESE